MRFPERSRSFYLAAALALAGCEAQVAPAAQDPRYPQQGGWPPGQLAPPGQLPQGYAPGQLPPQGYVPGQLPPQGYVPGQPLPQGYVPGQQPPQGFPPGPQGPFPPQAYPAPNDPINTVDLVYLRATAKSVLDELIAALPPTARARVQGVPFITDPKVGEVNAYAACDDNHMPLMAITDGLLTVQAYIAQFRATDELYGTQKLDGYLQMFVQYQKPRQPIVAPPGGFVDPAQNADGRKVARQHQILEEQLAFVLGHELGHHHLGHTGCANGQSGDRSPTFGDLARLGTRVLPLANQPLESDADNQGVDDLLAAGARRQGYHWTELGALLTLDFFARLDKLTPASLPLTFLSDHPFPQVRLPLVKQEAARFRASGVWATPLPMLP